MTHTPEIRPYWIAVYDSDGDSDYEIYDTPEGAEAICAEWATREWFVEGVTIYMDRQTLRTGIWNDPEWCWFTDRDSSVTIKEWHHDGSATILAE